jgi:Mycoplasma protein of unknown function, DUF285
MSGYDKKSHSQAKRWSQETQSTFMIGFWVFVAAAIGVSVLAMVVMKEADPVPKVKPSNVTSFSSPLNLTTAVDAYVASANRTNSTISKWDVSKIQDFSNLFSARRNPNMTTFNANISMWNVSNATSMVGMFLDADAFDGDLSMWKVDKVVNMSSMFEGATNFTGMGLHTWVTSSLVDMTATFADALSFNADLASWTTGSVESMKKTFYNAAEFVGLGLAGWVSNI